MEKVNLQPITTKNHDPIHMRIKNTFNITLISLFRKIYHKNTQIETLPIK